MGEPMLEPPGLRALLAQRAARVLPQGPFGQALEHQIHRKGLPRQRMGTGCPPAPLMRTHLPMLSQGGP